ncbi:MAG TPA: hypothetical protein VN943_05770 [Candidatus Acidoferrum sp.]|nr:hypothetical protein [Candidatus Acidoferrum sp.]
MHYEIQHYTIGRGWRNEWFYDEGDGIRAQTFGTLEEAWDALDEFFADLAEDIEAGHCPPCSREEFRILQIGSTAIAAQRNAAGGAP